jgi:AmmeMemoRadiSam system protein B/AmmeMemoRadiSam system protein A
MRTRRLLVPAVLLALLTGAAGCGAEGGDSKLRAQERDSEGSVRHPAVAGMFYPGGAEQLASDVDGYLDVTDVPEFKGVVGLIAPHAGYMYSGAVAGRAYSVVKGRGYDSVVVVAPSHRFPFRGASVFGGDGYETPLGVVRVDRKLADAISDPERGIGYEPRAHASEHSLEVQVPFLQRSLGDFALVPIIMGDQGEASVRQLASRIAGAVRASGKRVLLVASTDLSHYHSHEKAVELDSHVLDAVADFDPEGLLAALRRGECEACGGGPSAAVMMAARELGATNSAVVGYATSGDVTGDMAQVVGYMAAVLYGAPEKSGGSGAGGSGEADRAGAGGSGAGPKDAAGKAAAPYEGLTERERTSLLSLARRSIEAELEGHWPPAIEYTSKALETDCGAFVTLEERGALRGCIGHVVATEPLVRTVMEMAVQAAFHDPRFPPVTAGEVDDLTIEISVMSPLSEVRDVSEIEVGKHGLVVRGGGRSGLLLPQVATDYGWDRETFLEHTCIKAGLPPDSWKQDGVTIYKFSAEVFGEE